jgi:Tol biopolymer transport system component
MAELDHSPVAVRAELERILQSKLFRTSELPKRFLRFVVLLTLEEKAGQIKEYSIGAEAFGRGPDFDPRIDSVVRVVAKRVRDRLAEFYSHEGKADPVVIEIPTGSYVPAFTYRTVLDAALSPSPSPASPAFARDDGLIGATVSHYEVLELMARGGSGLVYRAEDLRLKRGVAFKVLYPEFASDVRRLDRFLEEARSASAVNHPNICSIYDVGQFKGRAYIVMELIEGKTLDQFVNGKPVPMATLLRLGTQIADALASVHGQGIIHSDVRSANVMVSARGETKLLDFSAARLFREQGDSKNSRRTSERADIVGLGNLLYEMATGQRHCENSPAVPRSLNRDIPTGLDHLIQKMIADSPEIEHVGYIRDELRRLGPLVNAPAGERRLGGFYQILKSKRTWIWAAPILCLAAAAVFMLRSGPTPQISGYRQLTHDGQGKLGAFSVGVPAPLVTDGTRLFFSEVSGSRIVLRQVSVAGGETAALPIESENPLVILDISQDRSELLATSFFAESFDHQLLSLPLPSGLPRPLGHLQGHDGAWSPHGDRLCYVTGQQLYIAGRDGGNSQLIAALPGVPSWPRWSPDGKEVRVTVQDSNAETGLWRVPLSGESPRRLLPGWNDHPAECCGSWTADGKYYVFQSSRGGTTGLWALTEKHGPFRRRQAQPIRLTQGPAEVWAPEFDAQSKRIFAVVQQRRGELVRYDLKSQTFGLYLGGISADHVEFSPDGQWIAYCAFPEQAIWRSRMDGRDRLQLSPSRMSAIFPRWSPDGRRIAFMGTLPGKAVRIFVVSAAGGDAEPLTANDAPEIDPNWSPDGKQIMFSKLPSTTPTEKGKPDIQILDLDTRRVRQLPGSEGLTAPRWSPNGRYVAATTLSQGKWGNPAVVLYDFGTGKWTGIERDPIDNKWWSRDGNFFYFDKFAGNDPAIYRLRLRDQAIERVASLKDVRRSFNSMGWWMGLTPDGSPMVLRDTSIEEIYVLDFKTQ